MPRHKTILDVQLPGRKVGRLVRDQHGLTFWEPSAGWEASGQHPRLGVAFLRQPGRRKAGTGLPAWFENLLPEQGSALRHRLCETHGLREADGLGLLRALGRDLSGAVEISKAEVDARNIEEDGTASHDSGDCLTVLSEQLRFSLAGMQLKLSMSMSNERLTLGASAGDTKWIVKLPGLECQHLPEVEHATMAWARNAGFDVPSHFVVQTSSLVGVPASWSEDIETAFAVRRFDRRDDGSKVHQEDLCQAFELLPTHKYGTSGPDRISHDGALRFVNDIAGEESAREMARRVGFTIACGNGDAHLKNWSLLWGNADRPHLTPCYDFVATVAWSSRFGWELPRGPELALSLGGERLFSRLNSFTLDRHVEQSQCPWARDEILQGIKRARDAWRSSVSVMPEFMRVELLRHWKNVPLLASMHLE